MKIRWFRDTNYAAARLQVLVDNVWTDVPMVESSDGDKLPIEEGVSLQGAKPTKADIDKLVKVLNKLGTKQPGDRKIIATTGFLGGYNYLSVFYDEIHPNMSFGKEKHEWIKHIMLNPPLAAALGIRISHNLADEDLIKAIDDVVKRR